jgi:hypothetical protein
MHFPPYGFMIEEWRTLIVGNGSAPSDWVRRPEEWLPWREGMLDLIADKLWPRYDLHAAAWTGRATALMESLTIADFELLQILRRRIGDDVPLPDGPLGNKYLFRIEDEADVVDASTKFQIDRSADATLYQYLIGCLSDRQARALSSNYIAEMAKKAGNVDLEMKVFLQRPRAYQIAYMLNQNWFSHNHAKSAVTPAMISGHCFEACMGGLAAAQKARLLGFPQVALELIARHTIDVGDRRVFAGVHYPSDNLASWIVALQLAELVGCTGGERQWLLDSIRQYSEVFGLISEHVDANKMSPFAEAFNYLDADAA